MKISTNITEQSIKIALLALDRNAGQAVTVEGIYVTEDGEEHNVLVTLSVPRPRPKRAIGFGAAA